MADIRPLYYFLSVDKVFTFLAFKKVQIDAALSVVLEYELTQIFCSESCANLDRQQGQVSGSAVSRCKIGSSLHRARQAEQRRRVAVSNFSVFGLTESEF